MKDKKVNGMIPFFSVIVMVLAGLSSASGNASDLVGHWSFDGCDGKVVKDRSGAGHDGVVAGGELRKEKGAVSLALDGLDGHVLVDVTRPLDLHTNITAVLWVKAARLRNNTVLFGVPNAKPEWTTPAFGMYVSGGRVTYGQFGDGRTSKVLVETKSELPQNQWVFLVATSDGSAVRLYLNGSLDAEEAQRAVIAFNGQPLLLGKGLGDKPSLYGRIGELRLYNRALSAGEVRALFEETRSAYELAPLTAASSRDGTVPVETHGNNPDLKMPWRVQPTRLLEKLDGYTPSGGHVQVNKYGGRIDRPREKATGFFYTKKIDGRWWLIDPEGCRFYHVAINTVREPKDAKANFGLPAQWADAVTKQLRDAGFNGLGNGSSTHLQNVADPLVWVLRHNFIFAFAREKKLVEPASGTQGFPNRCMPVFHPEFPAFCEAYGKALAATASDPTMLGIMTENELQCPVDLLDRYLASDASNPDLRPGRNAAEAWLVARRGSAGAKAITKRDRYEFIAYAFGKYYGIVTPVVRKCDPNHLYLGSRINYGSGQFDNPWFWKVLAPCHDVVSVNYYGRWGPQADEFADWAAWADRPVLITEWYAKAMDVPGLANTHGAGWLVRTQEDRARYYQHFALNALETKSIVGWHFFKYLDDPPESKALDNLGGANKGMFDAYGKPHAPLLERARAVNREVYPLIEFFDDRK